MSIKKNFIYNTILKLSTILFPLIIFPYVSRTIGADGIGKVSFATSVISYYEILAQLGVQTYGIRECAQARDDKQELSKRVQELLIINLITSAITYAVLAVSIIFVGKFQQNAILIIITSLQIFFNTIGVVWLFSGLEQYRYITLRSVVFKFISLILILLFVKKPEDYIEYGAILTFATVGSNVLNFFYSRKFVSYHRQGKYNLKRHLKPLFTFMLMSVATTVYTSLDTVMLGFMTNDSEVGYYNAAIKVRSVLLGIVNSLAVVLLPRASYYIEKKEYKEFISISRKAFNFVIVIGSSFWIYFSLFSKESILVLSGKGFLPAVSAMLCVMPTVLICGISNLTAIQMLVSLGKEKPVMYTQIVGAVIDLVLNSIFIPMYGAPAAAISTTIAEFVIMILQIKELHKLDITISNTTSFVKIIVANAFSAAISMLVKTLYINSLMTLIISAIVYFASYIFILYLMKENIAVMVIEWVTTVLRKKQK